MALADKYDQIVGNSNSAKISIRIDASYNSEDDGSLQYSPILEGDTQFDSTGGVFKIEGITFAASPGFNYQLLFETDEIDTGIPSNVDYL